MMLFLFFICVSSFLLCKVLCDQSAGRYDKNVNLFSSNGELMQVQYARNAGLKGASILCSNTIEGDVIMCVPTPADIQTLQDKRSVDKVAQISDGLWFAFSGLAGDGRALLKYARNFCIDYQTKFGSTPSIRSVARVLGEVQHESTLTGGKRPYGVQVILIGMDETGSRLSIYTSEPSGETSNWKAVSIGQNSALHMKKMEARWRSDMPTAEVVQLLVDIAGATSSDTDEPKLTPKLAPEMEEDNLRNGDCSGSKSMAKDMAVDLYRFSLKNPCTKKTPGCGYRMEYFRSPEDLTRSL